MKAAVIYENGGPDVLRYEDVPDPECPDGCVLIDVEAISVEGGDLLHRAGSPPPVGPARRRLPRRRHDRRGRRRRRATARRRSRRDASMRPARTPPSGPSPRCRRGRSPTGSTRRRAACVPVAVGTAQECLFTAGHLKAGQTVLIQAGAGGVGMAAIQLAKQAGATVIATASSDEKLERLKEFGLDHGINYATENFAERTRELTDGRGADVILDSIGGQTLEGRHRRARLPRNAGQRRRDGPRRLEVEASDLWAQNNTLRGVFLGGALLTEYPRVHSLIADLLRAGRDGGICESRSTAPSRSPRPPQRTHTSRAARPSVASCWSRRPAPTGSAPRLRPRRSASRTSSAVCATSRQPLSIVSEWPRFGIFLISVTASLRSAACRTRSRSPTGRCGPSPRR